MKEQYQIKYAELRRFVGVCQRTYAHTLPAHVCMYFVMNVSAHTYCRSSSFNESDKVPGYQDFVTPAQPGSGKVKRKLPVVRKQRIESGDQGETPISWQHALPQPCLPISVESCYAHS